METKVPSPVTGICLPSAIVENMAEFRPEVCTEAAQQGLLQWLLKRLKVSVAVWRFCSNLSLLWS
jgi:beta-catenin-like protein 1